MQNDHPQKGSTCTVQPIRRIEDINAIEKLLSNNPRDRFLFIIGVNNGLRVTDLLNLKVKDVKGLKAGDSMMITESKTGKRNYLVINKKVHKALTHYFNSLQDLSANDPLFKSRKTGEALKVQAVNKLIKSWTRAINLQGRYGCHSLRKTWGYQMRTKYGAGFEVIAKRFNHSNPRVTMRYLGIEDKEVHELLMNEVG
jgi:integrase